MHAIMYPMSKGTALSFCCVLVTFMSSVASGQNIHIVPLAEEQNGGTHVTDIVSTARLYANLTSAQLSQVHFQIIPASDGDLGSRFFSIPPNTSTIVTRATIDRDEICAYRDVCDIPLDIGIQPANLFQVLKFVIRIMDINDNAPAFPDDSVLLPIPETAQVGASFDLTSAEDLDSGVNSIQSYDLLTFQDIFELEVTETPEGTHLISLVLIAALDREERSSYALDINAKDDGNPPKTGSVTIQVTVLDTNDNNPEFENEVYTKYMDENNAIGSIVIQVRANDPDEGPSGQIRYAFSRQTQALHGDLFEINAQTGKITTKGEVDFEANQEYNLRVVAKDQGASNLAGYAQVVIIVRDLNDNAPLIAVNTLNTNQQAQVSENRDPGEFVAYVRVTDPDGGVNGEVTCTIDSRIFDLVELATEKEYKLTTAARFDREIKADYSFTMTCQDRGNVPKISTKYITVSIQDENDHAPVFASSAFEIRLLENSGAGISVYQVNASDDDIGPNAVLRYSLQPIGTVFGNDVLAIDPQSGIITTRVSLDYEIQAQYTYYVIATDNGTPPLSATANLVLTVTDTNDEAPTFSQPHFSFSIPENSPYNTVVGTVMAYDLDSPPYNQISYSFVSQGWDDHFVIDSETGQIRVTTLLDREQMAARQSYDLIVRASNNGYGLQNSVDVTIFVEDINDHAPVITFPSATNNTFEIKSSAEKDDFVTQIHAHDADIGQNGLLSYRIRRQSQSDLFSINRHTGVIYVNKDLQDHGNSEVIVEIEVSDNGEQKQYTRINLTVFINKTAASSDKQLVTNLTFVIAVVVTSVILVAIAVVIFVIFMLRRNQQLKKRASVYSCTVQAHDNKAVLDRSTDDIGAAIAGVNTVSAGVPSKNPGTCWPDVVHTNQVTQYDGLEKPQRTQANNYTQMTPGNNGGKRVHFEDSCEQHQPNNNNTRASTSKEPAAFLETGGASNRRAASIAPGNAAMYVDEGRHKLLYGADQRAALQLTSHNLQALHRNGANYTAVATAAAAARDDLSDQGSSVDSGRGPSEEDPDPMRAQALHNHSLNDSRESGESPQNKHNNAANNYMDMNKAQRHVNSASAVNKNTSQRQSRNYCKKKDSRRQDSNLDNSYQSSIGSVPPPIPMRVMKVTNKPHQLGFKDSPSTNPDLNVPKRESPMKDTSSTFIGKYNVRIANNQSRIAKIPPFIEPKSQSQYPSNEHHDNIAKPQPTQPGRCSHNVIDHFPELCQKGQQNDSWSRDNLEPDSRSDGGSTTSGSYMVDGAPDHLDLGPEISHDVFV